MKYKGLVVLVLFFWVSNAHAYLDPGTGSLILQSVIAIVMGGFFFLKQYRLKLMSYFSKKKMPSTEIESVRSSDSK